MLKVLAALHGHLDFLRTHLDKKLKSKQGFRTLDSRIVMAAGEYSWAIHLLISLPPRSDKDLSSRCFSLQRAEDTFMF